ncbi:hypothetical protein MLD38_004790 [Melastoma candidum]|uniref:Uncharacterized protein n=1 Tax=Melastoma candidum TaxID=119954 RepID=A0ACB9SAS7_9MYRT|nr:hypothetical protein MLD38_004790 [Melastoma candidum]
MEAVLDGHLVSTLNQLLDFPDNIERFLLSSPRSHEDGGGSGKRQGVAGNIPTDIVETAKEYVFYLDVPGIPKSDIQVTVEDERTLVIKSNGKRKREEGEDEGSKYVRMERRTPQKLMRKFRLPENADEAAISARCENGVLTLTVGKKAPPAPKSKTVQVTVS